MMFLSHIAIALELLVVLAAAGFIIWSTRDKGVGAGVIKVVGYIVLILAIFAILCTTYYTMRYWEDGYFRTPTGKGMGMSMGGGCPMMQKMMEMQKTMPDKTPAKSNMPMPSNEPT